MAGRWRMDMHTHCGWSKDSRTPLREQVRGIEKARLDVVCATDHDTIDGALRLREMAHRFTVVIGEEISSADGDLIGLFLERRVPPGLSGEETAARIHDQGGLLSVPHPFSRNRRHAVGAARLERLAPLIDVVEVFNAREAFAGDNRRAAAWAAAHGVPAGAGSDAHRAWELGNAWLEIDPFEGPRGLVAALGTAAVRGRLAGLGAHVLTRIDSALNRWLGAVR